MSEGRFHDRNLEARSPSRYQKWLRIYITFVLFCLTLRQQALTQANPALAAPRSGCESGALLLGAEKELKLGHLNKTRELAGAARKCAHLAPIERFHLGVIYGRLHEFSIALTLFQSVDSNIPSLQAHSYAIALGEFELGDFEGATETLKELQSREPLNGDSANLLAVCYSKTGQYQDAYGLLLKHLQDAPEDPFGYLNMVTLLTDVGQLEQAVKVATLAVEKFPDDTEMLVVRGVAYTAVSELDKARNDFAVAVAKSPHQSNPRFFLAVTDYRMSNYVQAADELRTGLAGGVVDADLEYLLAECILKIDPDRVADALKEVDRAIAISKRAAPAYTLRGKLLLQTGDARAGVLDLEKAHKIDPGLRSATYSLARAYTVLGRKPEADRLFQQIQRQSTDTVNELSDQRMRRALGEHTP